MTTDDVRHVWDFWFGSLRPDGSVANAQKEKWFKKDAAFDDRVRAQFSDLHASIHAGEREAWLAQDRSALAYVIVLDQFSRNMFRDDPRAWASDPQALRAAEHAIEQGFDTRVQPTPRSFFYMPFMHAEDVAAQQRCVQLFEALAAAVPQGPLREASEYSVGYARAHRDIVVRFGRFPHRNALLGRDSTAEEVAFLRQPGSSF